jgi:hypothetical protein
VHLVGFTIEIYYDAQTYERQIERKTKLSDIHCHFHLLYSIPESALIVLLKNLKCADLSSFLCVLVPPNFINQVFIHCFDLASRSYEVGVFVVQSSGL